MGYSTDFKGRIEINPPLSPEEINYLEMFATTRREDREDGPYSTNEDDSRVRDHNRPPEGQPGLWCQWIPTKDGTALEWDEGEKFYDSVEWMKYLIDHFLKPGALAAAQLPFLQANHVLNGEIKAQGADMDDRYKLVVKDNDVSVIDLE